MTSSAEETHLGKIASRKSWPMVSLSKPEIVELPQPTEKNETMLG
jgi:hypothetical protein